jgi:hypothetical protein
MNKPKFSEERFRQEVEQLDAWRNRMREMAVHLGETEYDEDTGEPVNRAAEIECVLAVVLEEIDQALEALRRITSVSHPLDHKRGQ